MLARRNTFRYNVFYIRIEDSYLGWVSPSFFLCFTWTCQNKPNVIGQSCFCLSNVIDSLGFFIYPLLSFPRTHWTLVLNVSPTKCVVLTVLKCQFAQNGIWYMVWYRMPTPWARFAFAFRFYRAVGLSFPHKLWPLGQVTRAQTVISFRGCNCNPTASDRECNTDGYVCVCVWH